MMDKYHPGYFGKVGIAGCLKRPDQLFVGLKVHLDDLKMLSTVPESGVQVGMRHFNIRKNQYYQPIINLDKLWSLVGHEVMPAASHCSVSGMSSI